MSAVSATPSTPKRRRLSPEERRSELLTTAIEVFAEVGIERAGHGEIARRAGVSTATVFNYFPTRADLVEAVLLRIEDIVDTMFETVPATEGDAEAKLLALADAYIRMITAQPHAIQTFLKWAVSFDPEVRAPWLAYQKRTLARLVAYLPDSPTAHVEARILFGASNMLAVMAFDHDNPADIRAYVRRLASALSHPA